MQIRFDPAAPYEVQEADVPFAKPEGKDRRARVYRPAGEPDALLAAIVDVHGGAWNRGDHTTGVMHCRALAASGLVVASLDFRQGPDHQHPAGSDDVAAGVRWAREHARELGVDPARIGLLGASSGGQLAILAAITEGPVAFVLALYPVADPLARYHYVLSREHETPPPSGFDAKRLIASSRAYFADEAAMEDASVTRIVSSGEPHALPPLWVAQPELDDNVPAAITEAFVRAYRAAGGALEHVPFPGVGHGFIQKRSPDSEKCIALMRDFIGRQLQRRVEAR